MRKIIIKNAVPFFWLSLLQGYRCEGRLRGYVTIAHIRYMLASRQILKVLPFDLPTFACHRGKFSKVNSLWVARRNGRMFAKVTAASSPAAASKLPSFPTHAPHWSDWILWVTAKLGSRKKKHPLSIISYWILDVWGHSFYEKLIAMTLKWTRVFQSVDWSIVLGGFFFFLYNRNKRFTYFTQDPHKLFLKISLPPHSTNVSDHNGYFEPVVLLGFHSTCNKWTLNGTGVPVCW